MSKVIEKIFEHPIAAGFGFILFSIGFCDIINTIRHKEVTKNTACDLCNSITESMDAFEETCDENTPEVIDISTKEVTNDGE